MYKYYDSLMTSFTTHFQVESVAFNVQSGKSPSFSLLVLPRLHVLRLPDVERSLQVPAWHGGVGARPHDGPPVVHVVGGALRQRLHAVAADYGPSHLSWHGKLHAVEPGDSRRASSQNNNNNNNNNNNKNQRSAGA